MNEKKKGGGQFLPGTVSIKSQNTPLAGQLLVGDSFWRTESQFL